MKAHAPSIVLVTWAGLLAIGCTWLSTGVALALFMVACVVSGFAMVSR